MSLNWPWRKSIRSTDPIVRCPGCTSNFPQVIIRTLANSVVRRGELLTDVTGAQYVCPMCRTEYCVGVHGTYAVLKPQAQPQIQRRQTNSANDDEAPLIEFGVPKSAPRV